MRYRHYNNNGKYMTELPHTICFNDCDIMTEDIPNILLDIINRFNSETSGWKNPISMFTIKKL